MSEPSHNPLSAITTGTIIRFFLIGLLLAALYYVFDVVIAVVAAVILASAIEPVVRRLKRLRIHRIVAVIFIYLAIVLVVGVLLIFFFPIALNDLISFLANVPRTISLESIWAPFQSIGIDFGSTPISAGSISLSDFVNGLQSFIVGSSTGALQTASVIFGGLLSLALIVVLSFYLAVQEEGVDQFLRIVAPVKHHDYIIDLWKRSQRKIGYWLQGQILLGVIMGVLVYLTLMIIGIPHALLLGILAAVLEIIPVFGPIMAAVPAVLLAFVDAGPGKGLLVIGLYVILQQFENQLFYPLVVKKIVGISPIVVILALVIGAKFAGLLGALIAVPLSAALMEYVNDIDRYKKAEIAERAMAGKS
ncbi:MAG: AI-2E family transporter [Candidatus Paceibacterota bacterium]